MRRVLWSFAIVISLSGWISVIILCLAFFFGCSAPEKTLTRKHQVRQLTDEPKPHLLGIFDSWSPDDKWIVYCNGPNETNDTIAKVNVDTGQIVILYHIPGQQPWGPGCGTPSYCTSENKVVFIHGPRVCGPEQSYEYWRRSAAAVEEPALNEPVFLDARDVTYPFTAGALRGGTHCHEWSGDGKMIAFTYNDMIMAEIQKQTNRKLDLRTIGVAADIGGVEVDKDRYGENFDGEWFSVLLVEVVPEPAPGSDEISRAYENCWVGKKGRRLDNGSYLPSIAFKGNTKDENGNTVPEVFMVDVPEDITVAGKGPLEGTPKDMPFAPAGTEVIRLTDTSERKYPGISTQPRFWLTSSRQGDKIFFLARDDSGLNQVYYVTTADKKMVQVTDHNFNVNSTVDVNPDGRRIAYIADGSVFVTDIAADEYMRLTKKFKHPLSIPIWSNDGSKIAFHKLVENENGNSFRQIFIAAPYNR